MFNFNLEDTFHLFSFQHILPLLITISVIILIILYRHWLTKNLLWLPKVLAIITITQHISLFIYRVYFGLWNIETSLPLQLCSLAIYFSAYVLWTKDKRFFNGTAFVMFIGAFLAILFPEITNNLGYPHFRYLQFFFSHSLILINITYAMSVFGYAKEFIYRDVYKNIQFILQFAVVALLVNLVTGGNYLYLMRPPGPNSAFELLGKYPLYIINILLVFMPGLFHLFYIPFYIYNKKIRSQHV